MNYLEHRLYLKNIMAKVFKNKENSGEYLTKSAILLGLKVNGNEIHYADDSDQEPYWDFTIYERINGKKTLLNYSLESDDLTKNEIKYLQQLEIFETALYKIGIAYDDKTKIVTDPAI